MIIRIKCCEELKIWISSINKCAILTFIAVCDIINCNIYKVNSNKYRKIVPQRKEKFYDEKK
ncbi:hypothetical protein [uncultured Ruminococcus sp.]|uniref:hypothetical protein n=1 Tax=uncultured Ruminococcus sp. TaxID=165186 RepID=UPI0025D4F77B|nr:hypothetical protein [uncultured Ruminococcus sp.]